MRRDSGFVLAEALIAMVLATVLIGSMIGVLIHQQRFYSVTDDVSKTASVIPRMESIVIPELLPLNPAAGDILFASPDSITARMFRGVFAVCDKQLTTDVFITVRRLTDTGPALSADSARIYSIGTQNALSDDHWKPVKISSVKADVCPDGTPGWTGTVPSLAGVLPEVPIGAAVRVFRHASYWLAPEDGHWYVKTDAIDGSPMVVGAALAPADADASSTLRFRYFDGAGDPAAVITDIARIEIEARAVGTMPTTRGGVPHTEGRTVVFTLRNVE